MYVESALEKPGLELVTSIKKTLDPLLKTEEVSLKVILTALEKLSADAGELAKQQEINTESDSYFWTSSLYAQTQSALNEVRSLTPWVLLDPVPGKFSDIPVIREIPTITQLARIETDFIPEIRKYRSPDNTPEESKWLDDFQDAILKAAQYANQMIVSVDNLITQTFELADMQYDFLHDKSKHLLAIGYNVEEHRRDPSFYDLLASEARLCHLLRSHRGSYPRKAGLPWEDFLPILAVTLYCFHGAVRCSST